jgi:hypothetical protein
MKAKLRGRLTAGLLAVGLRMNLRKYGILALLAILSLPALSAGAADNEGIAIWGHSYPADITPERLAAGLRMVGAERPDRPIVNQSIGGHMLDQSLLRMGAYEWTVEVAGGMIPASGRVELINPRSPNMAAEFNAGLPAIAAKYMSARDSMAELRVMLNSDGESWLTLDPNNGEDFMSAIFKGIRLPIFWADKDTRARMQTWVSIRGVVGQIGVDSPNDGKTRNWYFSRREEGDAVSVDGQTEVKMLAVGPQMQHDVTKLNRWLNIVWPQGHTKMRWPEVYGPSDQGQLECEASFEVQRLRLSIFVQSLLNCMSASEKRLILLTGGQGTAPASDNRHDGHSAVIAGEATKQFYRDNFPEYSFDFVAASLTGLGQVPPAKEWFAKTHPELFRDPDWGWGAELHLIPGLPYKGSNVHTGREKAAVAELRLTGNGGGGVTAAARVATSTPDATRFVKTGLFVGVEAENGVAVRLSVREGGRGYAVGDTITIPAGAVGNAKPITGEVAAIREETIGTVRHSDGTVDVANSYSQWDVDNGYWPRCFRRDVGHFSRPGAEYLSLLVAARIKELGW